MVLDDGRGRSLYKCSRVGGFKQVVRAIDVESLEELEGIV